MSRPPRLTSVFFVISVAALVTSGIVIDQVLVAVLRDAGTAADAIRAARSAVLTALAALGVVLLVVALLGAAALSRSLAGLRDLVLARARGDTLAPLPAAALGELSELASAVERLSALATTHELHMAREGAEVSLLLEAISEGILQLDGAGRVVRANPAARALLGLPPSAIGQRIATHVRHAELRRVLNAAVTGTAQPAIEITLDDRRLVISAHPLGGTSAAGATGAVAALMDLTELRRLESVRRDFVANVSHELKTPLTSIRGYTETLLVEGDMPADVRLQFLSVVQKNAQRLQHIVDDLLDLSRLESGAWQPELYDVNARAAVEEAWSTCSERAELSGITFVPPADALAVRADPAGLHQVLANLLDNALRYTPAGGRIEVVAARAPNPNGNGRGHPHERAFVTFEVRDTGTGIPSDELPRIFERFYRVDPARSRAEGGTGLGLSIVKHLVESMGGDIAAVSELGKGTTIRFRLPAAG